MITTTPEESKRIVLAGLQQRNARHEAFESAMIAACNKNCAHAKDKRVLDTASNAAKAVTEEERRARARARLESMQKAQRQEQEVNRAVYAYVFTIVCLLLMAAATAFPYWAAITLMLGLGVILAVHLYRVYVPLDMEVAR